MTDIHDFVKAFDLIGRKTAPMACCPDCEGDVPLISTLHFAYAEFYCLECGGHFGFLDPKAVEDTPQLKARHLRLRAEFDLHAKKLLPDGRAPRTEQALLDHEQAMAWLQERAHG